MLIKMLILLLHCTQQSTCSNIINIVQYSFQDKRIRALLLIISKFNDSVECNEIRLTFCSRFLMITLLMVSKKAIMLYLDIHIAQC